MRAKVQAKVQADERGLFRPLIRMQIWTLLLLAVAPVTAVQPASEAQSASPVTTSDSMGPSPVRVGVGDNRQGYEQPDYRSSSASLHRHQPARAGLAALVRSRPLGLPKLANPPSGSMIDLGRRLFFDRRLSANATLSCGMCHVPEQAFTQNELATPVGIEGRFVARNAPSLYNVGHLRVLFHDGRERDLTAQIWGPLLARNEMGNASRSEVLERLRGIPAYAQAFEQRFADGISERNLGVALAAYQQALLAADSPFDRWFYGGERHAVDDGAKRGFTLFSLHGCSNCHLMDNEAALLTDHDFHNTGIGYQSAARFADLPETIQVAPGVSIPLRTSVAMPDRTDHGRQATTGKPGDRWRFRTPGLRNVALTGPYMHDGSLATLEAVITYYDLGGSADPEQDPLIRPLNLSAAERADLLSFLVSLTSSQVDALAADARTTEIGDRR